MPKILMVDDDKEFLSASKALLIAKGHKVSLAHNAAEAELLLGSESFDLIFLDIMMEEADDGIALAQRLKKKNLKTPVVMLSDVSKVTGYDYGKCDEALPCADFLEKPVKPAELLKKIDSILKQK
mgnify:CR=1 FL=1